ncbi:hypothetical protein BCT39_08960 [Vibrio lentus]|uniref:hypothetical protein n=1 Tax=Vibrio lentus TaxID=136468 RepID=UPI000C829863|nr:hypothetical protein [Vibrio lentus]PMN12905.1 hypothetical protein BCT39_08960 [Vibrio lentus]
MSKLAKLKSFFTLEEAAIYLSNKLEEPVSLATLYQSIADKKLILSVRLINQAYAMKGQVIECEDGDLVEFKTNLTTGEELATPHCEYISDDNSIPISIDTLFIFDSKAHVVDGIWDLAMVGEESLRVENLYQNEVNGIQARLTDVWGFYLKQGEVFCRLITKSQQKIDQIQDDIASCLEFWADQRDLTVEQFLSFVEDCWEELSEDEIQALDFISNLVNQPDDSLKFFEDLRSIEQSDVQLIIKTSEITRLLRSLDAGSGIASQEAKQSARKVYTRNNDKQMSNKVKTQAKYSAWQKKAIELKKAHPNKPKTWIAAQIAKSPISEGKSADTIRKNIKI